jgi:hypothetical protein
MKKLSFSFLTVCLIITSICPAFSRNDPKTIPGKTFFSIKKEADKFWFSDPHGMRFLSIGINNINWVDSGADPTNHFYSVSNQFKNKAEWASNAIARVRNWKYNTIGSWSDPALFRQDIPFTAILYILSKGKNNLLGVFENGYEEFVDQQVKKKCVPYKDFKYLVGYFIDNELPWYGDRGWYSNHITTLLDEYLKLSPGSGGKRTLIDFFKKKYKTIHDFNKNWNTELRDFSELSGIIDLSRFSKVTREDREEFAGLVAERYFSVITKKIRKYDPNHLILGVRFAGAAPEGVIRACGKYCDVVSLNYYCWNMNVDKRIFHEMYYLSKKPVLVTEFSYRADDNNSGNQNKKGAYVTVRLQGDRAYGFEHYVKQVLDLPYVIGYHWFEYYDQSPEGRTMDGEDSDYGILDIHDREYAKLVKKMIQINGQADSLHYHGKAAFPVGYVPMYGGAILLGPSGPKREPGTAFCDVKKQTSNTLDIWGDMSTPLDMYHIKITQTNSGPSGIHPRIDYITGSGWGLGFTLYPDIPPLNSDKSCDLSGFSGFLLNIKAPKDLKFYFTVNESGAARPWKRNYDGVRGADGESFISDAAVGIGKFKKYHFDFRDFTLRWYEYGNQLGNITMDLQAIKRVDIWIYGKQGGGTMEVSEVALY